ncbi:hypothetical protein [Micromonospora carbonacea]|uniref:hypothetical protein n=1 Tax=Micromonospora carbonacea TaxID=47853 RepID=UPI003D717E58
MTKASVLTCCAPAFVMLGLVIAPEKRNPAKRRETARYLVEVAVVDACTGDTLGLRSSGASKRMTPAEITAWLARRQSPPKRCKLCEPALPGAYGSQASDVETGPRA